MERTIYIHNVLPNGAYKIEQWRDRLYPHL